MEVAEKYKQTEIGLIPSDWEVKELGSILTFGIGLLLISRWYYNAVPLNCSIFVTQKEQLKC